MNDERATDSTEPWEAEMSREFDQRVRDLHEAPLSFETVRGKAMTIRRNRRIAVAGGVLAAAAVIVPVAVFAGTGLGDSNGRIDPAPAPTVTRATDPNDPSPSETATSALGTDYLEGRTWRRADGSTVELEEKYDGGTVLGDDLLAVRNTNGRLTIDVVDGEGEVTESIDTWSYPLANTEHTEAAWIERGGRLVVRTEEGDLSESTDLVDGDSVAAVLDGRVFVTHGDGSPPEFIELSRNDEGGASGGGGSLTPEAVRLNDVADDGRMATQTSYSDAGSCSAVFSADGAVDFDTCDYSFDDFSPDGGYLSASDAYRDGFGMGYVVILDAATGEEVSRWEADNGEATDWVWEDEGHLLIQAYEQNEWRIHRLGVDGSTQQVLASTKGNDMSPPFTLLS